MSGVEKKTWKLSDLGRTLKNCFFAILKGELLLRMNVGRYLVHVFYTFLLLCLTIWISLMTESTMVKVEKNRKIIEELEILHTQKTFETVSLSRRSSVEESLAGMGSTVRSAEKPATVLVK